MAVHTWRVWGPVSGAGAVEVVNRARLGGVGRQKYKGAGHDARMASFFLRIKKYQNDKFPLKNDKISN